ncbi:BLUE COPPER PROTEIN [Salix viminalis]|uniref:BLUE COPPER PROTEIN n=1 Tax=Salix viminalis TaxID=40686 RepID=A0A9Q0U6G4_SALVM|nr:BLUE COPPER PROTEIN [Salix viminalis]
MPGNTSSKSYLNDWAENKRFQIGDTLTFVYDSNQDSVVQVTKEGYENCSATLTTLSENLSCGNNRSRAPAASPPSPGVSGMVPAPTPSNEESPPPGTSGDYPNSSSYYHRAPPSSDSSMLASFIGSMGAFLASSLILAI